MKYNVNELTEFTPETWDGVPKLALSWNNRTDMPRVCTVVGYVYHEHTDGKRLYWVVEYRDTDDVYPSKCLVRVLHCAKYQDIPIIGHKYDLTFKEARGAWVGVFGVWDGSYFIVHTDLTSAGGGEWDTKYAPSEFSDIKEVFNYEQ